MYPNHVVYHSDQVGELNCYPCTHSYSRINEGQLTNTLSFRKFTPLIMPATEDKLLCIFACCEMNVYDCDFVMHCDVNTIHREGWVKEELLQKFMHIYCQMFQVNNLMVVHNLNGSGDVKFCSVTLCKGLCFERYHSQKYFCIIIWWPTRLKPSYTSKWKVKVYFCSL
jgi:hypothetical protein